MSMNWQTFRTRSITALVFVAVMLTGLCWNAWSFFILFSFIHFGCWKEYHALNRLIVPSYGALHSIFNIGLAITGWSVLFFFFLPAFNHPFFDTLILIVAGAGILCTGLGALFSQKADAKSVGRAFIGLIYLSLPIGLILYLRTQNNMLPLWLMASIWINDTMAYVVGSFIGKTPLSSISPKKTWEGTIGGILLSVGLITVASQQLSASISTADIAAIAVIASITGTLGDLLESKLKRMAGVKDSGSILPGHGGFLDRFDSLLIAAPCVAVYWYWVN